MSEKKRSMRASKLIEESAVPIPVDVTSKFLSRKPKKIVDKLRRPSRILAKPGSEIIPIKPQ